jgi:hypothetical protein
MKKTLVLAFLTACAHGTPSARIGSVGGVVTGSDVGGDVPGDGACKTPPDVSLGTQVPTPGSFVGVATDAKIVYFQDVGCKDNATRLLADVLKLIGPPASHSHRVDGDTEITYYQWENATLSLGLMIMHQGGRWHITLGFAPARGGNRRSR